MADTATDELAVHAELNTVSISDMACTLQLIWN